MPPELTVIIGGGALLIAVFSLVVNVLNRRDAVSSAQLGPLQRELDALKLQCAQQAARSAESKNEMLQFEIRVLGLLREYSTSDQLEKQLTAALKPVLDHVAKTEEFMDEVIRSGVLRPRND